MTALSPDRLVAPERRAEIGLSDVDSLGDYGPEMHLDAPLPGIVKRHVLKTGQVEVASEFAIDAGQKVAIEFRRNAQRVVVGRDELGQGLFQIGPEQQS